jgi:hypothetical protein
VGQIGETGRSPGEPREVLDSAIAGFVPSEQEDTPFSASQVRGRVLQDPNGYGRGWVPGASAMTGAGAQEHARFSQASLCITQHPVGPMRFGCPICRGPSSTPVERDLAMGSR